MELGKQPILVIIITIIIVIIIIIVGLFLCVLVRNWRLVTIWLPISHRPVTKLSTVRMNSLFVFCAEAFTLSHQRNEMRINKNSPLDT